jgi:hypothetical protein
MHAALTKECQNVVQVTKDGKTVNYFLEAKRREQGRARATFAAAIRKK